MSGGVCVKEEEEVEARWWSTEGIRSKAHHFNLSVSSPVLLGRGLGHEAKGLVPAPRLPLLGEAAEGEGGHWLKK